MWLSERLSKNQTEQAPEKGTVTLSHGNTLEAGAAMNSRSVRECAPYGYASKTPAGAEVMLLPVSDGQLALGINQETSELAPGEVKITSLGGASLVLKNDGTVVINSKFVIDREGNVK